MCPLSSILQKILIFNKLIILHTYPYKHLLRSSTTQYQRHVASVLCFLSDIFKLFQRKKYLYNCCWIFVHYFSQIVQSCMICGDTISNQNCRENSNNKEQFQAIRYSLKIFFSRKTKRKSCVIRTGGCLITFKSGGLRHSSDWQETCSCLISRPLQKWKLFRNRKISTLIKV